MALCSLLDWINRDDDAAEIFSVERSVQLWLTVEAQLALAQSAAGVIPTEAGPAIARVASSMTVDLARLRHDSRNVGYPILPLVRQLDAVLPDGARGWAHFGATTQDIMDTALALQLRAAIDHLLALVDRFGAGLAALVRVHEHTIMAGRTHAQQAVVTTFGAKCGVFLAELARHRHRLVAARRGVAVVSLAGAAGTSAAYGPGHQRVRQAVADALDLADAVVPWHVARDGIAESVLAAAMSSETAARFAREVIDLSRTEIGEVREAWAEHRGASSTMPQKANPISSEACIGYAVTCSALVTAMLRAMEAGHERSAGEWQVEWKAVPEAMVAGASAIRLAGEIVSGLAVDADRMAANLEIEGGLYRSEAYMMALAPRLGRERAHDLVYRAATTARAQRTTIERALTELVPDIDTLVDGWPLTAAACLGDTSSVCRGSLAAWREASDSGEAT